jgi:hypothetical protein
MLAVCLFCWNQCISGIYTNGPVCWKEFSCEEAFAWKWSKHLHVSRHEQKWRCISADYWQGFFPNANLPGMPGFLHPLKFYFPTPKIGPTFPPKYFLFCPSPVFFSSTFDRTIFFINVFPGQTRFHGKNPWLEIHIHFLLDRLYNGDLADN